MRRGFLHLLILPAMIHLTAQSSPMLAIRDTLRPPEVTGNLTLTNIGFAPIPAFSFNDPMITTHLSLKKGKFQFAPDFALGVNGKPWMANNWFRFSMLEKRKWRLNAAINPFLFFEESQAGTDNRFIQVQRNISFELAVDFKPTLRSGLTLVYRYNKGNDGGLSGHLFDLSNTLIITSASSKTALIFRPQLFYFDFTGSTNGLFSSAGLVMSKQGLPFSLQVQGVWLLKADFAADPFSWNTGFTYSF